jgi:outer membrane lipopolysaccharide assembly protein LptE/RlpB
VPGRRDLASLLPGALVLLAGLWGGCGYHLAGKGSTLPQHVHRISVPLFENRTQQPEIAQRITEQVTNELIGRGVVVSSGGADAADALLQGGVNSYTSVPVGIGTDGRATRYEIVIQVQAELRDVRDESVLWKDEHFLFRRQYDVDPNEATSIDRSIVAIELVSRDLARSMVAAILEGF